MKEVFPRDKADNLREKEDSLKRQKRTAFGEQGASEEQRLCNFPVTKCPLLGLIESWDLGL
jgi:hypothetical protein